MGVLGVPRDELRGVSTLWRRSYILWYLKQAKVSKLSVLQGADWLPSIEHVQWQGWLVVLLT